MKIIQVDHCTKCPFIVTYSGFYSSAKTLYCTLTFPKTEIISGEPPFNFDIPEWCPIKDGVKIVRK